MERSLDQSAGGAVGGGCEESFGRSSILHGRLHLLNHRVAAVLVSKNRICLFFQSAAFFSILCQSLDFGIPLSIVGERFCLSDEE